METLWGVFPLDVSGHCRHPLERIVQLGARVTAGETVVHLDFECLQEHSPSPGERVPLFL